MVGIESTNSLNFTAKVQLNTIAPDAINHFVVMFQNILPPFSFSIFVEIVNINTLEISIRNLLSKGKLNTNLPVEPVSMCKPRSDKSLSAGCPPLYARSSVCTDTPSQSASREN